MWKTIIKKCFKDILLTSTLMIFLVIIFYSVIPIFHLDIEHKLFFYESIFSIIRYMLVVVAIGSLIENIITEFELISSNKWIRRLIIISVAILLVLIALYWSGFFSGVSSWGVLAVMVFVSAFGALASMVGYVIEDKRRKKEIADINERLNELNPKETNESNRDFAAR